MLTRGGLGGTGGTKLGPWLWSRWDEVRDKCSRKKAERLLVKGGNAHGVMEGGAPRGWAGLAEKGCEGISWDALLR